MPDINIELYRGEDRGTHFDVALTVKDDGAVQMSGYDLGELPEKFLRHEDYEYWVTVPATEVQKLLFALLKEKYLGRKNAARGKIAASANYDCQCSHQNHRVRCNSIGYAARPTQATD